MTLSFPTRRSSDRRSSTQLSMDLQGAWALGDVNRIAESYHWVGLGTGQARTIMQRLDRLAEQPLWQAHYFDARIGGAMHYADAAAGAPSRSEEHTSELQSLMRISYAVFCLK